MTPAMVAVEARACPGANGPMKQATAAAREGRPGKARTLYFGRAIPGAVAGRDRLATTWAAGAPGWAAVQSSFAGPAMGMVDGPYWCGRIVVSGQAPGSGQCLQGRGQR